MREATKGPYSFRITHLDGSEIGEKYVRNVRLCGAEKSHRVCMIDAATVEDAELLRASWETRERLQQVEAQRDALLAACEEALTMLTADGSGHITMENSLRECDRIAYILREAIVQKEVGK